VRHSTDPLYTTSYCHERRVQIRTISPEGCFSESEEGGQRLCRSDRSEGAIHQGPWRDSSHTAGDYLPDSDTLAPLLKNLFQAPLSRNGNVVDRRKPDVPVVNLTETKCSEEKEDISPACTQDDSEIDHLLLLEDDMDDSSEGSETPSEYMTAKSNPLIHIEVPVPRSEIYSTYDADVYKYLKYRETLGSVSCTGLSKQ
jgi:hypothetical protein